MKVLTSPAVAEFRCAEAECPDTCCHGLPVPVDAATVERYRGTAIEESLTEKDGTVMLKQVATGCVLHVGGRCAIHAKHGAEFLCDACHFYPKAIRRVGVQHVMTGSVSCPEMARRALFGGEMCDLVEHEIARLPHVMREIPAEHDPLSLHRVFVEACRRELPFVTLVADAFRVAVGIEGLHPSVQISVARELFSSPGPAEPGAHSEPGDPYLLNQIFHAVLRGTSNPVSPRLAEVIERVEVGLGVRVGRGTLDQSIVDRAAIHATRPRRLEHEAVLKRLLLAQLHFGTFPHAGMGSTFRERATILVFRMALTSLFLSCFERPEPALVVQVVQTVARVFDHSGPKLTMDLISTTGFTNDARILAMLAW